MRTLKEIYADRGIYKGAVVTDSGGGQVEITGDVYRIPGGEVVAVRCLYTLGNGVVGYTYTAAVCNLSPVVP